MKTAFKISKRKLLGASTPFLAFFMPHFVAGQSPLEPGPPAVNPKNPSVTIHVQAIPMTSVRLLDKDEVSCTYLSIRERIVVYSDDMAPGGDKKSKDGKMHKKGDIVLSSPATKAVTGNYDAATQSLNGTKVTDPFTIVNIFNTQFSCWLVKGSKGEPPPRPELPANFIPLLTKAPAAR